MALRAALVILLLLLLPGARRYAQQPNPAAPTDVGHQAALTSDWGRLRTEVLQDGIAFDGSYTAEVFANTAGGTNRGASYDGLLYSQIDAERLGGGSLGNRKLISLEGDAGLSYKGLIPARADDTLVIARIGANARGLDQNIRFFSGDPSYPGRDYEAVLEVTYQAQLTPWMTLQRDVQYVFRPDGHVLNAAGSIRRDALVFGLHSVLSF